MDTEEKESDPRVQKEEATANNLEVCVRVCVCACVRVCVVRWALLPYTTANTRKRCEA